jgi:hypothetical protein
MRSRFLARLFNRLCTAGRGDRCRMAVPTSAFPDGFEGVPFKRCSSSDVFTKLLGLPIPYEPYGGHHWPDPMILLVHSFYPMGYSDNGDELRIEIRELGYRIIAGVKSEMDDLTERRAVLADHRRRWTDLDRVSGPYRKPIIARRIALTDEIMAPSS